MKQVTNRRTIFTTLDGLEINFKPFSWDEYQLARSGLQEEYRQAGKQIDRPQYTVKFASGTTQQFDHDENTIMQAPPETPVEDIALVVEEQRALWAAYQEASKQFSIDEQALLTDFVFDDSLGHIQIDGISGISWEDRQRKRHINIPTDPEEKRRHYINTVMLKAKSDQIDLLSTIVAVSMGVVKEEDIEAVKASFRDSLWGNGIQRFFGRRTPGKTEDTDDGRMDGESTPDGDPGAQTVAINEG